MNDPYDLIRELFDYEAEPTEGDTEEVAKGRNSKESADFGKLRMRTGAYEEAIEHFRRAVEQGDVSPDAWVNLAAAYEVTDQAPQAYRQYLKALKAKEQPEARAGISSLLKRQSRFREAIAELERAIEHDPVNASLHQRLAETLRESGLRTEALLASQRAVACRPDDAFFHWWMGDLLIELGRFQEATEALRACLELSPGDDYGFFTAALALWGAGRHEEALSSARYAYELNPGRALYKACCIAFFRALGKSKEAEEWTKKDPDIEDFDEVELRNALQRVRFEPQRHDEDPI